jgi:2-polyprenyl-3-methyl-5-hydroxy-6-metoxy-1,4-benzoquinol methylase
MADETREPQYQGCLDLRDARGLTRLGLMSNQVWHDDPKRLTFLLARYKFVAKMLARRQHVLEVGCADAFGTRIVQQEVGQVTAVDFDPVFIADARERMNEAWPLDLRVHDMLTDPVHREGGELFDGAYSLDVLEHIPREQEGAFLTNLAHSLGLGGAAIIGSPSLESQAYASPPSREGHVNCKSHDEFVTVLERHFDSVFLFSMNDEVVHTGFYRMAHYLMALCCGPRRVA